MRLVQGLTEWEIRLALLVGFMGIIMPIISFMSFDTGFRTAWRLLLPAL